MAQAQQSTAGEHSRAEVRAKGRVQGRGWILRFQQRIHMIWVQLQKRMLRFGSSKALVYVAKRMY